MEGQGAIRQIDPLLLPYLRATNEEELDGLLAQLISEQALPIIKAVIRSKLRVFQASDSGEQKEAEELAGESLVQLITRLQELRINPHSKAIGNFHNYVAAVTYNAINEHLRQKYPQRSRVKSILRYFLSHREGFALWKSNNREWLCGFALWRDQEDSFTCAEQLQQLRDSPHLLRQTRLADPNSQLMNPADLLTAVFQWSGSPIPLDDLVNTVTHLLGIKDHATRPLTGEEKSDNSYRQLPDQRADIVSQAEQRSYLQRLWTEICQLPLGQRIALLLNLTGKQGNSCIELFPLTGIASIREIAQAASMSAERFAGLWNQLPLNDATIAKHLHITRQQVINLRKSARERLARRMEAFEKGR